MLKEMGRGIRDVKIEFQNPIVVSQRLDEGILLPENFTNPKKAIEEYYPDGAYGYSEVLPMVIKFERPLQLSHVYLKQHRAPNFYLKSSIGTFNVQGFLSGRLALNATLFVGNTIWKQYSPQEFLILDTLVIPPGMDIDNLLLQVDMSSEEFLIAWQNTKKP